MEDVCPRRQATAAGMPTSSRQSAGAQVRGSISDSVLTHISIFKESFQTRFAMFPLFLGSVNPCVFQKNMEILAIIPLNYFLVQYSY